MYLSSENLIKPKRVPSKITSVDQFAQFGQSSPPPGKRAINITSRRHDRLETLAACGLINDQQMNETDRYKFTKQAVG
jgi:hypothetical protein